MAAVNFVGWAERSETHHGDGGGSMVAVGFAALNPPYKSSGLRPPAL